MEGNRYYWLRLKQDFFKRKEVSYILALPQGKEIISFYLMLLCESMNTDGYLAVDNETPYDLDIIASITNNSRPFTKKAVGLLMKVGLLELTENNVYYLPELESLVGSEVDSTERLRKLRIQRRKEGNLPLQCNDDVTQNHAFLDSKCNGNVTENHAFLDSKCNDRDKEYKSNTLDKIDKIETCISNEQTQIILNKEGSSGDVVKGDLENAEVSPTSKVSPNGSAAGNDPIKRIEKECVRGGCLPCNEEEMEELAFAMEMAEEDLGIAEDPVTKTNYISVVRTIGKYLSSKEGIYICGNYVFVREVLKTFRNGLEMGKDKLFIDTIREISFLRQTGEVKQQLDYLISTLYNRLKLGGMV